MSKNMLFFFFSKRKHNIQETDENLDIRQETSQTQTCGYFKVIHRIGTIIETSTDRSVLVKVKVVQCCLTICNPWTIQAMEFSRSEYWSGQPFPSPEDLPNPGIKPMSPTLQRILYQLSHKGRPRILEWVAYPFSSHLPDPGIELGSSVLQPDSLPMELSGKPCYGDN